jgi:prepilin-type N-terminal cleavage/methylation domain-containing protein
MYAIRSHHRRGMTLVELMIVVVILSLLAVTVLPALNRAPNKSLLRDTATTVQGHISQGVSKSIGNRTGYGVWFDGDAGMASGTTATMLGFCPGITTATGSTQIITASLAATTATLSPGVPTAVLSGTLSFPGGTVISFIGFPYEYDLNSAGTSASFRTSSGQSNYNTSFPFNTTSGSNPFYSYVVAVPPTRTIGIRTALRGNACIDMGCSSIGVIGYGGCHAAVTPALPLKLTFDSTGRATGVLSGTTFTPLTPDKPLALLIGLRDQVGAAWNPAPSSEDDPGSNLQRRDAYWVVLDPRTATSFVVENSVPSNNASAGSLAANVQQAQAFVRQSLVNRKNAQ